MSGKSSSKPSGSQAPALVVCHYALCFIMMLCKLVLFMSVWTKSLFGALLSALRVGGPHSLDTFQLYVKNLNRTPEHVALIFNEEQIFVNDIANAVVCCVVVGIGTISLYDYRGILQARRYQIEQAVNAGIQLAEKQLGRTFGVHFAGAAAKPLAAQTNGKCFVPGVSKLEVISDTSDSNNLSQCGTANGHSALLTKNGNSNGHLNGAANGSNGNAHGPPDTESTIFTFSFSDSRPRFAKTVRDMLARESITESSLPRAIAPKTGNSEHPNGVTKCDNDKPSDDSENKLRSHRWTTDELDRAMQREYNMVTDPQLALVFGPWLTTAGYPPWHVRLTEFVHVATHRHLGPRVLFTALRRFAKCEQRFGK